MTAPAMNAPNTGSRFRAWLPAAPPSTVITTTAVVGRSPEALADLMAHRRTGRRATAATRTQATDRPALPAWYAPAPPTASAATTESISHATTSPNAADIRIIWPTVRSIRRISARILATTGIELIPTAVPTNSASTSGEECATRSEDGT